MVGKKGARVLDRADWELLVRQYQAGASVADIMDRTGLSESWVRHQVGRYRKADPVDRARAHLEALRRELIRTETILMEGSVDAAVKRMRALNMLVKLEKEINQTALPDGTGAVEAEDFEDAKAELERRFARLRADKERKGLSECADQSATPGTFT